MESGKKSLDEIVPRLFEIGRDLADKRGQKTSDGDFFRGLINGIFMEIKYFSRKDYVDIEGLGGRLVISNTGQRPEITECYAPQDDNNEEYIRTLYKTLENLQEIKSA
jgi:hypothetical protein